MKKQNKNILIGVIIAITLIGIIFFIQQKTLVIPTADDIPAEIYDGNPIQVSQIYSVDSQTGLLKKTFSIFSDKSNYNIGETAKITDYQDINVWCVNSLQGKFTLLDSSNSIKSTTTKSLLPGINGIGYMTAFYEVTVNTAPFSSGSYTMESRWYCDGVPLTSTGYLSPGSNSPTSVSSIQLISTTNPPTNPPAQTCSKSCNEGYRLINPNSVDCYCTPAYSIGDGNCDIGEPVVSEDCIENQVCKENEIKADGICFPKDLLCESVGGTKYCPETTESSNTQKYVLYVLIVLGIGLVIFGLWRYFKK